MAIYRETFTKPLPANAELFTKNGVRFARWKDAKGKTRTAKLTLGRDGQQRITVQAKTYTAKYRDGEGLLRKVATGCTDEQAARAALEKRAVNVLSGITTPATDAIIDHQAVPLNTHLEAYFVHMQASGVSATHLAGTRRLAQRVIADCNFSSLRDIDRGAVESWLVLRTEEKMGARTRNSYLQAIRGFCVWCLETSRLLVNPLQRMAKADERSDRRKKRRAMTEAELSKLLEVTRWRPLAEYGRQTVAKEQNDVKSKRGTWTYAPLSLDTLPAAVETARKRLAKRPDLIAKLDQLGRERQLIYKTLVLTGLRKGELASLTVAQLTLDGPSPTAELYAADEKNRQGSTIAIRSDLADELRTWIADKAERISSEATGRGDVLSLRPQPELAGDTPLFTIPEGIVKVFDRDLEVAGIAKEDERGRTLDIHALRHTFATLLSSGGVVPRTVVSVNSSTSLQVVIA